MTRSQLPHSVSSHRLLGLDIVLDSDGPLVAGTTVEGVLQLNARSGGVALGEISLELVVEAEAKTSFDRVHEVLYDRSVVYQGPELPLSNAVISGDIEGYPGFHRAKKGVTSFPICLPIPARLPSSYASPFSSVTYTLHATCHFASECKGVLHVSQAVDVVQSPLLFKDDLAGPLQSDERLRLALEDGSGSLALRIKQDRGWISSEDLMLGVVVSIANSTYLWTLPPILRLVKRTRIDFPHEPFEVEEMIAQEQYDDQHVVPPHCELDLNLRMSLPADLRSTESSVFTVRYLICALVHLAGQSGGSQSVEASLPIEILHPSSVPVEAWFASATAAVEARHPLLPSTHHLHRPTARTRWSMPAGLPSIAALLSPLVPLVLQPQTPYVQPHVSPGQAYAPAYPQPAFVVHQLPPIAEEHETKAGRTSRHLRETSGNRGRSVSPPILSPQPRALPYQRDQQTEWSAVESKPYGSPTTPRSALGFGPRPMPRRSSTSAIPKAKSSTTYIEPAPQVPVPIVEARSLEQALVPPLEQPTLSRSEKTAMSEDQTVRTPIHTPMVSPSSSPVRSRKSVFDLFASDSHHVPASFAKISMVGPTGSARGGRGGKVTSLKEIFKGLNLGQEKIVARPIVERPKAVNRLSLPAGLESLRAVSMPTPASSAKMDLTKTNKVVTEKRGRVASMVQMKEGIV